MKIVFVSAEVAPYSKTGGLADVAGSLPKEFIKMGHEVLVITPRYREVRQTLEYVTDYSIPMFNKNMTAVIKKHVQKVDKKELKTYFVDNAYYFDREGMYCHPDEAERFAFFDKAACRIIDEFQPDIVHLNDWQAGPIAVLLRDVYKNYTARIMYTIHNMEYNGRFSWDSIYNFGLDPNIYMKPDKLEFFGDFSFSKCGILYSDVCTTVSATYANEIQTEEFGFGYEGLLRMKKEQNKLIMLKIAKKRTMIAIVSRVVQHKGYDILIESLKDILKDDVQFVQLGIGDDHYIKRMCLLRDKYPDKVSINNVFDDILAERIYAGADIFMMPSLFEPCGLAQLICFRYGTIPVARKTGGLNDTVIGYLGNKELGNGFTFFNSKKEDLTEVTRLALTVYDNKEEWRKLQKRVMLMDCSWKKSAEFYQIVYNRML